jgi:hypothetical protein
MLLILYCTLLFKLNKLLFRLMVFKLNNENTVQNKLHHKIVIINNNSFNLNNKVGIRRWYQ